MSYDYEGFRFTSNVNVGAGESSYAGFASRVDGEVGSAFITIATAAGAMMGLYNISVAAGEMAVISVDKTTEQNNGKLNLSATASRPSEKEAAQLKADNGFSAVVTAVDGTQYRILESSAYVVVNSSRFNYELSATQSVKAKELFENVEQLLSSPGWRSLWAKVEEGTKGQDVDVITWAYNNVPETRSVIDGCRAILGEVPIVTYTLNVKNGVDTEAPTITADGITIITMGNRIKAECTGASDNYFVYGFEYQVLDGAGAVVDMGVVQDGTQIIRPTAALGDGEYTLNVRAYDYSGNYSDWVNTAIVVNNNLYIESEGMSESDPVALTKEQTVEKGAPVEYTLTPEYSGSYNFILEGLDNKAKITITEYSGDGAKGKRLRSKTMSAKNFAKGAGAVLLDKNNTYTLSVSSGNTANYTVAVEGTAFVNANQIPEDTWSNMKTVQDVASDMKVMIHSNDQQLVTDEWVGFSDKNDVRELAVTTAGKMTFELTATDKTRLAIYVENPKNGKLKKLKSVSVGKSKSGSASKSIKNLLLEVGTYFLVVESTNASKGGNADYSVVLNAGGTELFKDADLNPLDNSYDTAPELNYSETGTLVSQEWVGFGDKFDYFRLAAGEGGAYDFAIDKTNAQVRLTVFEVVKKKDGSEKLKSVKKVSTSEKSGWSAATGVLMLGKDTEYVVAVESPKASKGVGSYYSLELKQGQAYNWANNTQEYATVLSGTGYNGVLSKAANGDEVDYIDIRQFSGSFSLDMVEGKAKVSWLNAAGEEILETSKVNTKNGIEFDTASIPEVAFLRIDADSKKLNQYSIAALA